MVEQLELGTDYTYCNSTFYGGGGATHITSDSNLGQLSQYSENQDYVLIVAGAGGGASINAKGGYGGGTNGGDGTYPSGAEGYQGTGGTQTQGGYALGDRRMDILEWRILW